MEKSNKIIEPAVAENILRSASVASFNRCLNIQT